MAAVAGAEEVVVAGSKLFRPRSAKRPSAERPPAKRPRPSRRRAMVLILVLIVVVLIALGAYSFTDLMLAQHEATILSGRQRQARALVDSGIESVRLFLGQTAAAREEAGGIFNNEEAFRNVTLIEDDNPDQRGCFTVLAPNLDDAGNLAGVRYGLEDESTRLNLNTLLHAETLMPGSGRQLLMALPGMTEDVADAILDWLDPDEEPRELGAEIEYYSALGYAPKNGPLETVEELLLVRGVTPYLLFGSDSNRNGQLDTHEQVIDDSGEMPTDVGPFGGWSRHLTLHSLEWNVNAEGLPRIYLNEPDLNKLYEELSAVFPPEWVTFIIAYRQSGPVQQVQLGGGQSGGGQAAVGESVAGELNMTLQAKTPIGQVLDLVDAQVRYTFSGSQQATTLASPFTSDLASMAVYMPTLMDNVSVNPAGTIPGRININQAPQEILLGIPGITPEIVDQILMRREIDNTVVQPGRRHETWLLQEAIVSLDEMKTMMPFVCGGGNVYRGQIVGYFQGGQASSRAEVIFDATYTLPRVLFWRDISHLGRGYALETLGVDYSEQPSL